MPTVANLPFLIARRRNERSRNGPDWLRRVACAGVSLGRAQFVDAEVSVRAEALRSGLLEALLRDGRMTRRANVTTWQADALWDDWGAAGGTVDCHLARYPDFDLELPAADLVGAGSSLLMLDGDTVMATSRDMTRGIVLDLCADGAIEQIDVDVWG